MKFYTNLFYFKEKDFTHAINGYFSISHMFFYMCLLPKEYKLSILSKLDSQTKNAFESILKIEEQFCSFKDSDYILLPYNHIHDKNPKGWEKELFLAKKFNKKILFFLGQDHDKSIKISKEIGYVFRSSGYLSESNSNVFGLPTINCDVFNYKYAPKKLSISFCGHKSAKSVISTKDKPEVYKITRGYVINSLLNQMPNECDFILQNEWTPYIRIPLNMRINYFKNLSNNLYGLCVRGGGNFSFRMGEILMMGRIPILINTECILPFRNLIPYEKNFILINYKELDNAEKIIKNYHESHTENQLIEIQKQNRKIWEEYFLPCNAFNHIKYIINNFKI